MAEVKKRIRRTAEQRLADLEKKQAEILERQRTAIAKIEEAKKRLLQSPASHKEALEREKRFKRAAAVMAPDWDVRHYIAALEKALHEDAEGLKKRGEVLLEEHGKGRPGRRPRKAKR
ncbi:hypothetical protein [Acidithiobacillus thiooxidans]|uniref:Uncharacterized protein n=1 Tax=Acidithiobacillus thiooxidans ATCC 19377 TaxID=637390 RepID=A0A5P9XPE4_ACITH|nr:hypothetical protein [Acidithiobacillus thiooxidans]QFX95851.1 hypothetical protein GCD22_01496 [Acidithiobacillus thiooxidans ATCC 19377]